MLRQTDHEGKTHTVFSAEPQSVELVLPEDVEYWINTKTFIEDICQGYDKDKVCEVLHGICWLLKNEEKGRWQHQRRVGKARRWYFVLANEAPPETEE